MNRMMKPIMIRYCLLVAILQTVGMVSMTSMPFSLFVATHKQDARPHLSRATLNIKQGASAKKVGEIGDDEKCRGMSRLGSRPPNCEHKCRGCEPCEAIQIPATTDRARVQYANYEPEGWKCKCGSSFFDP